MRNKSTPEAVSKRFSVSLVLTTLAFLFIAAAAGAQNIPVIKCTQNHMHFGKVTAFIGKNELRLVAEGGFRFILCSRAPKWDVIVYRPDDKTMYKQSYDSFCHTGILSEMIVGLRNKFEVDPKLCHPHVVNGITVMSLAGRKRSVSFVAPDQINPKIEEIIYLAYKMPTEGGFPLQYTCLGQGKDFITGMDETGRMIVQLSTSEITKTSIPSADFDCPANLKQVAHMQEVMFSKKSRSDSDGVFQELMR